MTLQIAMDARPGGPAAKHQPSPEGLGINPEDDLSAVGAALNLGPPPFVIPSSRPVPACRGGICSSAGPFLEMFFHRSVA